jgi:hypothetical protein
MSNAPSFAFIWQKAHLSCPFSKLPSLNTGSGKGVTIAGMQLIGSANSREEKTSENKNIFLIISFLVDIFSVFIKNTDKAE